MTPDAPKKSLREQLDEEHRKVRESAKAVIEAGQAHERTCATGKVKRASGKAPKAPKGDAA